MVLQEILLALVAWESSVVVALVAPFQVTNPLEDQALVEAPAGWVELLEPLAAA